MDVAVLDQALAERDPGRAREADRGRRARVGDRQDEVGLGGRLGGEPLAHPHARAVHLDAVEPRVGPGEVEELEDAERAAARRAAAPGSTRRRPRRRPGARRGGSRARTSRRPGRARRSRRRRPGRRRASRARAAGSRTRRGRRTASRRRARRPSRRPRSARARRRSPRRAAARRAAISAAITSLSEVEPRRGGELLAELVGVRQVAVVAERDRPHRAVVDQRLRVRPRVRARSSSSACARSRAGREAPESFCSSKTCVDEPEVAQPGQPAVLGDRDPGRLLAAVLQRVEPEVARAARRRGPVRRCRRRRTSDGPELDDVVPGERVGVRRARASRSRPARRGRRAPVSTPLQAAASRSASAPSPSATSCASVKRRGVAARRSARARRPRRAAGRARSPRRQRDGIRVTSATRPTQPTTGVGGIGRPPVSL